MTQVTPTAGPSAPPVREARPDELPTVGALLRAAYEEYAGLLPRPIFDAYLDDLARIGPGATPLVIGPSERPLGTARFYADATRADLGLPAGWALVRAVGVRPEARGQGIGAALMAASADRARAAGVAALALHTADFMAAAKRLYHRLGYRPDPAHDFVAGPRFDLGAAVPIVVRAYTLELASIGAANTG